MEDKRQRAYQAGAAVARQRMEADAPLDAAALSAVEAADVVVVPGAYDHVERVLDALAMPHTVVTGDRLAGVRLRPEQLVVVNCPGTLDARQVQRLAEFVGEGGSLFTTDWALKHVVEPGFPGVLSYNQRPTTDDVVRVEIVDHDNPFLRGVMDANDDPQWWLEASSYPIQIHDPDRVHVLMSSSELETKYGEAPVAVLFRHGEGEVFHMISHYYLQRTELRTARHSGTAKNYFSEKGAVLSDALAPAVADLSLGDVESAASSARLFANVVAAKKRRATRS